MSGHSKWSSIKHKKGAADARRGKIFTKLIREITVAAKLGGGDPTGNPRLRAAIAAAKAENMPKENIERGIKKGLGEIEGVSYEEVSYEGYGPGGVAVLVECLTDNKKRTVAEVKHLFERHGGSVGEPGCVAWMFEKKGLILVDRDQVDEERLLDLCLEAGSEDVRDKEDEYEIITEPGDLERVKEVLEREGIQFTYAEVTMIPKSTVRVEGRKAEQMINLMQALEDSDDVSHVYANFDISDELLEAMG